jgi:apolipoprotein N-acyltransferase
VQAAPTGFSSVITPDGVLLDRTDVSEQRVVEAIVQRRAGATIANRVGPWPVLGLAVVALVGHGARRRRDTRVREARRSA